MRAIRTRSRRCASRLSFCRSRSDDMTVAVGFSQRIGRKRMRRVATPECWKYQQLDVTDSSSVATRRTSPISQPRAKAHGHNPSVLRDFSKPPSRPMSGGTPWPLLIHPNHLPRPRAKVFLVLDHGDAVHCGRRGHTASRPSQISLARGPVKAPASVGSPLSSLRSSPTDQSK